MPLTNAHLIPAKCSSCGANMEVPDKLDKVHCLYCGSEFLISESASQDNSAAIENFMKLAILKLNSHGKGGGVTGFNEYIEKAKELDLEKTTEAVKKHSPEIYRYWLTVMVEEHKRFIDRINKITGNPLTLESVDSLIPPISVNHASGIVMQQMYSIGGRYKQPGDGELDFLMGSAYLLAAEITSQALTADYEHSLRFASTQEGNSGRESALSDLSRFEKEAEKYFRLALQWDPKNEKAKLALGKIGRSL